MPTNILINGIPQPAPLWGEVPFSHVAAKIIEGIIECPELEKYYSKKYEQTAKDLEFQSLTNH